ncbi:hypothetical protein ABBQ38_009408 [Trebouxia sp. C0009 RCD-2024]
MLASRPVGRLESRQCALLVCDVQERFTSLISGFDVVVDTCRRMVAGASALQLPILLTEQYPKALGATKTLIQNVLPATTKPQPKMSFSMCGTDTANWWASHPDIKQVMLCGIEAHVCVLQTALDLLEQGVEVHLVVDGISSQRLTDRQTALTRATQSGAFLGTSEMLLFQIMQGAKHPAFKTISALFKESRVPTPLPGKL